MTPPTERIYTVFFADGRVVEMLTLDRLRNLVARGQVMRRDQVARGRTRRVRAMELPELEGYWPDVTGELPPLGEGVDLSASTPSYEEQAPVRDERATGDDLPSGRYTTRGKRRRSRPSAEFAAAESGSYQRAEDAEANTSGDLPAVDAPRRRPPTASRAPQKRSGARPTVGYTDNLVAQPLDAVYAALQSKTPFEILCAEQHATRATLSEQHQALRTQIDAHPDAATNRKTVQAIQNWQQAALQALTQDRSLYLDACALNGEDLTLATFMTQRAEARQANRLTGSRAQVSGGQRAARSSGRQRRVSRSGEAVFADQPTELLPDGDPRIGPLVFGVGDNQASLVPIVGGASLIVLLMMAMTSGGTQELTFWQQRAALWLRPVLLASMAIGLLVIARRESPARWGWQLSPVWGGAALGVALLTGALLHVLTPVTLGPDVAFGAVVPLLIARGIGEALFYDVALTRTALIDLQDHRKAVILGASLFGLSALTYVPIVSGKLGIPLLWVLAFSLLLGLPLAESYRRSPSLPAMAAARTAFWLVLLAPF